MTRSAICLTLFAVAVGRCDLGSSSEAFWPQFHGPARDNLSGDTGLLKHWPEDGPPLAWRVQGIGHGFATVSIGDGRIYTAGDLDGQTVISALDLSGKILWQTANGPSYDQSHPGARVTPTFDKGRLYHLGDGPIACFDAATGRQTWSRNLFDEFGGRRPRWGLAESPLIDGSRVICSPGSEEIAMVALDKQTGQTLWTCRGAADPPGYSSAILVEYGGLRQIVTMTAEAAIGVAADNGELLWRYEHPAPYDVNACTPIHRDGRLILTGTWGRGATMLKLNVQGDRCTVEEVWRTKELDNEHGGVVLVGDFLFGHADGNHRKRHWACLEFETGGTAYSAKGLPGNSGTLTYADGMLYCMGQKGDIAMVEAVPDDFRIINRFKLPPGEGPYWAHLVVCGGRLYVRHSDTLYCYDVRDRTTQ